MMHVCLILIQSIVNIVVSYPADSIVLKHSWISTVVHHVCKYTSINTTFS